MNVLNLGILKGHIQFGISLHSLDERINYGVYANGGLLVETCSISTLKNKSNMTRVV